MGTYEELKAAIQQVIRTNGNNEITGALLQNALLSIVNVVGANATFAGIATPNTNPGTADQNIFYLVTEAGTYVNFGGIVINEGEAVILSNKTGNWVKTISGFATQQQLTELESKAIYDVTANNDGATFVSLSALLSSENLSTLIPPSIRCGGMSIRFVQSPDNKYAQYRYMETDATTAATFTNVSNWQGVDDEPTAGSDNLVKSGGTFNTFVRQENSSYDSNLDIADEKGNIIARYHDGIHETKYPSPYTKENSRCDLSFEDKEGNTIFKIKDGYPETKNFDGKAVVDYIQKNNFDIRKQSFNDALNATADLASKANSKKFFSNYEFGIVNSISIPNPDSSLYVANRMASIGLVNNNIVVFISRNFLNPANSNTVGSWITYDSSYNVLGSGWVPTPQYIQSVAQSGNYILRTDFVCCIKDEANDILYYLVSHYACVSEDDIVDAEFTLYKTTDGTTMEYVKSIQSPVDEDGNIVNLGGTIGLLENGILIVPLYEFAVRCSGYMEIPLNSPLYSVYMNKKETGYTPNECVVYKVGNDIVVNARCESGEHRRIFVRHNGEWYPYYDDVECKGYACYECWIKNGAIVYRSMTPNVDRKGLILYGSCFNGGGTTPILTVDATYGGYSSMAIKDNTKIYLVYEGYFDDTYRTLKLVEIQATPKNNNPSILW